MKKLPIFQRTVSFWRRLLGAASEPISNAQVAEERRQSLRYNSDLMVSYCAFAEGATDNVAGQARLRDVSGGGINLVVDREFKPGELLSIQLPDNGKESATSVLACVVHVNAQGKQEWSVGCTFSGELSREDLQSFDANLPPQTRTHSTEQRGTPRHLCEIEASFQLVAEEPEENLPAQVLNISTTGVGLRVRHPIATGKLLNVELHSPGRDNVRNFLCCAVHVTDQGHGEWLVGCNFITELDEGQLKNLVNN
jgi:c-di-GMP-binding flagellar brake protein YcgR